MKPAADDALARQHSGGPSPFPVGAATVTTNARSALADVEAEIAGLFDRSTQELRLAWRNCIGSNRPLGLVAIC